VVARPTDAMVVPASPQSGYWVPGPPLILPQSRGGLRRSATIDRNRLTSPRLSVGALWEHDHRSRVCARSNARAPNYALILFIFFPSYGPNLHLTLRFALWSASALPVGITIFR